MRCLFIAPNLEPREIDVDANDLRTLNALVGGTITVVGITPQIAVILNDDGLNIGLPPNVRTETGALLVGNMLVTRTSPEGDSVSLTSEDVAIVHQWWTTCSYPVSYDYDFPMPTFVPWGKAAEQAPRQLVTIAGITVNDFH
jgi:hypothetical protein